MAKKIKLGSISSQLILDALISEGVDVEVVSQKHKLMKITHQKKSFFIKGTSFSVNSQPSCIISNNKFLTKQVLNLANVSNPKAYLVNTRLEVKKIVTRENLYPCVLKPTQGAHGNDVFANIETPKELESVLSQIFPKNSRKEVLIEEHIKGRDYRILVVGDKISAIMERIPAHVVGDGKHTISELIKIFNSNPLVGKKYEKPLCKIKVNGEVKRNLSKKGIGVHSIPKKKEQIFLRQNANISTGGIGKDATKEAPEIVKTTALLAAKSVGMGVAGVDIMFDTLSQKAYVLELNDQPGIDIHHFPVIGQAQPVAEDIVDYILSQEILDDSLSLPVTETVIVA